MKSINKKIFLLPICLSIFSIFIPKYAYAKSLNDALNSVGYIFIGTIIFFAILSIIIGSIIIISSDKKRVKVAADNTKKTTNSIVTLIISICGIFCFPCLIIGLVMSIMGLSKKKENLALYKISLLINIVLIIILPLILIILIGTNMSLINNILGGWASSSTDVLSDTETKALG